VKVSAMRVTEDLIWRGRPSVQIAHEGSWFQGRT
jgi:hypothetical protein